MDGKYVFISYKVEDSDDASWVKSTLESNGIQCWMAPDSIPGGSSYATEIENAIKNCTAFVLVLSERAQSSKWVSKEVDRAINFGKRVLPFTLDNAPLKDDFSFYLSNVQRYDATTDKLVAMQTMIEAIRAEFNAPQARIVFRKKPPKTKNNIKGKKSKFLKTALIILVVVVVLGYGINLLSNSIASSDTNKTSSYQADSETTEDTENSFQSWFNKQEEETANPYEELLNNLTFELDGVTYSMPCSVSELYENGWVCETRDKDEVQINFYVEMKKGNSSIWIKTYPPFEYESAKFIEQKVGTIEYTPDCNVSFSVNGTIQPGSHYNDIIEEFGEPDQFSSWGNNTEYIYYSHGSGDYLPYATFLFYTDTSRCYSIKLENEVYSKKY